MLIERLNVEALTAKNDGPIGCDECGTADAVWGLRFEFTSDAVDEPYTVALCHEHFQTLARKTGGRLVAPAKADDLADAMLAPVAVESTEGH